MNALKLPKELLERATVYYHSDPDPNVHAELKDVLKSLQQINGRYKSALQTSQAHIDYIFQYDFGARPNVHADDYPIFSLDIAIERASEGYCQR